MKLKSIETMLIIGAVTVVLALTALAGYAYAIGI